MPGITIADAEVRVTASGSGVVDSVVSDLDGGQGRAASSGSGLGRSIFGGVVGAWAAIGGVQAVTSWFTGAVSGASDLNETLSKTEAIFGANTGAVTSWASTSATTVGMSQQAALAAASSFGDMFTQIGFTGEAAANMSTDVVQAAADLGSFSNLDTADVADRMSAAFRGEYDSLQAVIPNINAARVESEALAMTGKDTAESLTAQERAAAVLAIVQQDGARAMGDFARTSDGAANASRIATARLEDQQTALGQQLLPVWVGFLGFINDVAIPGFTALVSWIGENKDMLIGIGTAVAVAAGVWGILTAAVGAYRIVQTVATAATAAGGVAQWALNAAMAANPIGIVVALIAVLVGAIVWVATQTTFFQDVWVAMTTWIGQAWANVTSFIVGVGNGIAAWWNGLWSAIGGFIAGVWQRIVAGVTTYVTVMRIVITTVVGAIVGWWNGLWSGIGSFIGFVWGGIVAGVTMYVNLVRAIITGVVNGVAGVWRSVWGGISSFFSGIWEGIMGTVRTVAGVFGSAFNAAAAAIRGAFSGVVGVIRGVINGIIGAVNGAIGGLNGALGVVGSAFGINVSIPRIPMLARGTNFAPDVFIAGENGPELVTGAKGATVTPYSETRDRLARDSRPTEVHVTQHITTSDPELAGLFAARKIVERLGI